MNGANFSGSFISDNNVPLGIRIASRGENTNPSLYFFINTNPENQNDDGLAQRMAALGIREVDIEESFVRSGGHGGQNVNKTSTCVMLVHRPSGLSVKCQTSRQQGTNRLLARRLLLDKIEARQKSRAEAERSRIEKVRRQKRGRSRAGKERMLADKLRRARTKKQRRHTFND